MSALPAQRMRNIIDPEDAWAQEKVAEALTVLRRERFSVGEFTHLLGITKGHLWQFEHGNRANMSVLAAERRAAPLGLRLALDVEGMPEEVEEDLDVMILAAARPTDVQARATATALLTASRLQVARVLLGVTEYELAPRMGIRQATVNGLFREVGATTRIASFQRIARALGGRVVPRLVPLNGESDGEALGT